MRCLAIETGDGVLILHSCLEMLRKNVGFHHLGASNKRPVGLRCMMPIADVSLGHVVGTTVSKMLRTIST